MRGLSTLCIPGESRDPPVNCSACGAMGFRLPPELRVEGFWELPAHPLFKRQPDIYLILEHNRNTGGWNGAANPPVESRFSLPRGSGACKFPVLTGGTGLGGLASLPASARRACSPRHFPHPTPNPTQP